MKIVEILNGMVHHDLSDLFETEAEAKAFLTDDIHVESAPDFVFPGWVFDANASGDDRFVKPSIGEGLVYDDATGNIYNPEEIQRSTRKRLHAETTNDTLEALRKIREGDQTIDWSAWLDQLDAYNLAIEATKEQEGYPLKVTYPEYPTKPTPQS